MYEDKLQSCQFISASAIVPESWKGWFWEHFSEGAPFSWGDNNRTLVVAEDFARHAENFVDDFMEEGDLTDRRDYEKWIESIYALNQTYIDLEN